MTHNKNSSPTSIVNRQSSIENPTFVSGASVVIYCASSAHIEDVYFEAAKQLGKLLAENDIACITGAGKQGLMGAVNDSVLENGGNVTGVIPQFMIDSGWCHSGLSELIVTESMHRRKAKMAEMADAAIALPGGLGTLEELAEILTWKQLGLFKNPIIILNVNGYYDSLLAFLDHVIDEKFMHAGYRQMWQVTSTPEETLEALRNFTEWKPDFAKYPEKEL